MNFRERFFGHLKTVHNHRALVRKYCFRIGLIRQGLTHDLSKYSPTEFIPGVRYYQGNRSPNESEREHTGLSLAWLHHKGRNRHHLEYWIDYSPSADHPLGGMKMPEKYVAEMFCDRLAASRTYKKEAFTQSEPWQYYSRCHTHYLMHPESRALLEKLLMMLRDEGEEKTLNYIRCEVLHKKPRA